MMEKEIVTTGASQPVQSSLKRRKMNISTPNASPHVATDVGCAGIASSNDATTLDGIEKELDFTIANGKCDGVLRSSGKVAARKGRKPKWMKMCAELEGENEMKSPCTKQDVASPETGVLKKRRGRKKKELVVDSVVEAGIKTNRKSDDMLLSSGKVAARRGRKPKWMKNGVDAGVESTDAVKKQKGRRKKLNIEPVSEGIETTCANETLFCSVSDGIISVEGLKRKRGRKKKLDLLNAKIVNAKHRQVNLRRINLSVRKRKINIIERIQSARDAQTGDCGSTEKAGSTIFSDKAAECCKVYSDTGKEGFSAFIKHKTVVSAGAETSDELTSKLFVLFDVCRKCERVGSAELFTRCSGVCGSAYHVTCVQSADDGSFTCEECTTGVRSCFTCKCSMSGSAELMQCILPSCRRFYHVECLGYHLTGPRVANFKCPLHTCATCLGNDTPAKNTMRPSKGLVLQCVRCPVAFHVDHCVPVGTRHLGGRYVLCTNHAVATVTLGRETVIGQHVHATWCLICSQEGDDLVQCAGCPASYHIACVSLRSLQQISPTTQHWKCPNCVIGKVALFGEPVWVKVANCRWWPGKIRPFNMLRTSGDADNGLKIDSDFDSVFDVQLFGCDISTIFKSHCGRILPFHDGSKLSDEIVSSRLRRRYHKAIDEATSDWRSWLATRNKLKERDQECKKGRPKPAPYKHIKCNFPVGKVEIRHVDALDEIPCCECRPDMEYPCGPLSDCLNRDLFYECYPAVCPAGEKCGNQCFQRRQEPKLKTFYTGVRGWGLRTQVDLEKGQFVTEYVGDLIDKLEAQRRLDEAQRSNTHNFYMMSLDDNRIIDAGPKGNWSRFMNNSCEPNCETQKWLVNGDIRIGLFTVRKIPAGTELTFNYNMDCFGCEKVACKCGSTICSGYLGMRPKTAAAMATELQTERANKRRQEKLRLQKIQRMRQKKSDLLPEYFSTAEHFQQENHALPKSVSTQSTGKMETLENVENPGIKKADRPLTHVNSEGCLPIGGGDDAGIFPLQVCRLSVDFAPDGCNVGSSTKMTGGVVSTKKQGRPRKSWAPSGELTPVEENGVGSTKKRGRPQKSLVQSEEIAPDGFGLVEENGVVSAKKMGRPRKSLEQSGGRTPDGFGLVEENGVVSAKKRGRPRKSLEQSGERSPDGFGLVEENEVVSAKKRGRPRKSLELSGERSPDGFGLVEENGVVSAKKRGRPRKSLELSGERSPDGFGLVEENGVLSVKKRGRPRKSLELSGERSPDGFGLVEENGVVSAKKRGRPRKSLELSGERTPHGFGLAEDSGVVSTKKRGRPQKSLALSGELAPDLFGLMEKKELSSALDSNEHTPSSSPKSGLVKDVSDRIESRTSIVEKAVTIEDHPLLSSKIPFSPLTVDSEQCDIYSGGVKICKNSETACYGSGSEEAKRMKLSNGFKVVDKSASEKQRRVTLLSLNTFSASLPLSVSESFGHESDRDSAKSSPVKILRKSRSVTLLKLSDFNAATPASDILPQLASLPVCVDLPSGNAEQTSDVHSGGKIEMQRKSPRVCKVPHRLADESPLPLLEKIKWKNGQTSPVADCDKVCATVGKKAQRKIRLSLDPAIQKFSSDPTRKSRAVDNVGQVFELETLKDDFDRKTVSVNCKQRKSCGWTGRSEFAGDEKVFQKSPLPRITVSSPGKSTATNLRKTPAAKKLKRDGSLSPCV